MGNFVILNGQPFEVPGLTVDHTYSLMPHAQRPATTWAKKAPRKRCSRRASGLLNYIVLHHDACLRAVGGPRSGMRSCYGTLMRRGLSTHFCIGNDGTVYQFLDPGEWSAWHAGREVNQRSIGIDISNACELRYAERYTRRRPIMTQKINGGRVRWTAPYWIQIEALKKLLALLCPAFGIPADIPRGTHDRPIMGYVRPLPSGILAHFHISKCKSDPFGLDWDQLEEHVDRLLEK